MGGRRRKIRESCPKDLGNLLDKLRGLRSEPARRDHKLLSQERRGQWDPERHRESDRGDHVVPFMFEMDFREETGDEIGLMKTAQGR
jgi:hypothetical protein